MTRKLLFDVVTLGRFVVPLALALIVVVLPHPRSSVARSAVAIATAWVVSVVYTIYLYNPAGIAAGHELGWTVLRCDLTTTQSLRRCSERGFFQPPLWRCSSLSSHVSVEGWTLASEHAVQQCAAGDVRNARA